MTQEELLQLISTKDEKALPVLYDKYANSLFGVISHFVKDQQEAQQILHQVFRNAWMNIDSYDANKGRFYTWLLTNARQTAMGKATSSGGRSSEENFLNLIDADTSDVYLLDNVGMREFVKKLKPKCIQLIEQLFYRGKSVEQLSAELEIPATAVQTQNRDCILSLRNQLQLQ